MTLSKILSDLGVRGLENLNLVEIFKIEANLYIELPLYKSLVEYANPAYIQIGSFIR